MTSYKSECVKNAGNGKLLLAFWVLKEKIVWHLLGIFQGNLCIEYLFKRNADFCCKVLW